ncbi:P-loop NTPase [Desulfurivibrio dismutans]|uniref:P-loop NTPase n=1 Tax=Desulfurivibrio dismutans TaxID=1398908 RepID=UPI0023DC7CB6|nr:P-loop NTPase [Desulfurivibrio alkaliphilus]MDF1615157.1 P-loop NTPase [Desulfurivibrio alkaliphilus]
MQKLGARPVIIPIASGKGGAGKSVFAASLAINLARRGARVVAADLDLGGSNLHTYLGLPNTNPGVGDFLKQQRRELQKLLVPTSFNGLRFLPGDGKTPFMANIPSQQRFLLLSQLQQLPADYVIIDLGAGSALNTMNLFGLARNGIVITTLDTPAMMNALVFLRNFMFANIISLTAKRAPIKKDLLAAYRRSAGGANLTVEEVYRLIERHDPLLARETRKRCGGFQPRLVYNMADEAEELQVAQRIESTMKKNLSLQSSTLGLLFHDPAVRLAVRKNRVFLQDHPDTPYARGLAAITERILQPPAAPRLDDLIREAATHRAAPAR